MKNNPYLQDVEFFLSTFDKAFAISKVPTVSMFEAITGIPL